MSGFDPTPVNLNFRGESLENRLEQLDKAFSQDGGPSFTSALGNMMHGIKILGKGPAMATLADDVIGLSFTNRPMLALDDDNVSKHPRLSTLYKAAPNSLQNYVRGLLDYKMGMRSRHPWLDNLSAFIPLTTNLLKSSTGLSDLQLEVERSSPGIRGEVYQHVNGILEENGSVSVRDTYYNVKTNIIPFMFRCWLDYIAAVKTGDHGLDPYDEALYQNYTDFDCRKYFFIMNKNFRNIESIYMTVQSIPGSFPSGSFSAIDNDTNSFRGQGQDEVSMDFNTVGMRFDSWEVIDSFNGTYNVFNPDMNIAARRNALYRKLSPSEWLSNQWAAYPYININTMELEWWVPQESTNTTQSAFVSTLG